MKKLILFLILLSSVAYAKINAIVSILPIQSLVKEIGQDKVNVALMVKPGNSPHTYAPKPSQMKDISKANLYFAIGVEFENVWLPKFKNQNKLMKIVDLSQDIQKIDIESLHHKKHLHLKKDPHIWTSTNNLKTIAFNIYNELVKIDAKNKKFYKINLDKVLIKIKHLDKSIKDILKDIPNNSKFMVFHPAWGYFAAQYHLKQLPIELEGKSPKPKTLAYIINEAKKQKVKAIFTQPEFSDKIAKTIANQLHIKVLIELISHHHLVQ